MIPLPSRSRQWATAGALLLGLVYVVLVRESCSQETGVFFQRMTMPPPAAPPSVTP